jgi:hypothetical protein
VRGTDAYYYYDVDGSQVPLRQASQLAVDLKAADAAGLPAEALDGLKKSARELRPGIVMLDSANVSEGVVQALDAVGALQPVFSGEANSLVVVLPEVRIETKDNEQASKVRGYLKSADVDLEVIRDAGERIVVRPLSGRGVDALDLANRVEEEVHPVMAQARFLRVVPKR